MPSDDYSYVGGGALKLKGAKVRKPKKKKRHDKPHDLERALSTGDSRSVTPDNHAAARRSGDGDDNDDRERPSKRPESHDDADDDYSAPASRKTEAERRFDEAKRKKLLEMAESAAARPELLKTHKQRVEELNTYLSKLSEHHDMPKIGPG